MHPDSWLSNLRERKLSPEIERLASICTSVDSDVSTDGAPPMLIELRHTVPHVLGRTVSNQSVIWNVEPLLTHPENLVFTRDLMRNLVDEANWKFNTIVALSAPSSPLATCIATDPRIMNSDSIRLHQFDNYTMQIVPANFQKDQRILLVDTLIRTGAHLSAAYEYIRGKGGTITGAITICLGVLEPEDVDGMVPLVAQLLQTQQLLYAYTWRQVLALVSG